MNSLTVFLILATVSGALCESWRDNAKIQEHWKGIVKEAERLRAENDVAGLAEVEAILEKMLKKAKAKAARMKGNDALEVEERNDVINSHLGLVVAEVERLEAVNQELNNTNTEMQADIEDLNKELNSANVDRKKALADIEALKKLIKEQGERALRIELSLKAALKNVNSLLSQCEANLAAGKELIEEESVCPTFDASHFKCENHGRCRVRINTYSHKAEPYCECRRGFSGRTCRTEGEESENPACQ